MVFESLLERILSDLIVAFVLLRVLKRVCDHVETILAHPRLDRSSLLLQLAWEVKRRGRPGGDLCVLQLIRGDVRVASESTICVPCWLG